MKNILLILLLFTLFAAPTFSQQVFAPMGTRWTYTEHAFFPPIPNSLWNWKSRPWRLESVAEQVVQGKQCQELVGGVLGNAAETEFHVYSQNDSVFLWNGQQFTLLYDFRAKSGDSWIFEHPQYTLGIPAKITVDSVGLTQVGQVTLKTWYVHYDTIFHWGNVIYEGIGNSCYFVPKHGLIDRIFCDLRCFTNQAQELLLGTVPCDFVDIVSKVDENPDPNAPQISLNPNPARDETNLTVTAPQGRVYIALYDGQGNLLKGEEYHLSGSHKTILPLSLRDLPEGMLWIRCEQDGFVKTSRLVHLR